MLIRVASALFLLWASVAVVVAVAALVFTLAGARRVDRSPTVRAASPTESPRPRAVPADAQLVSADTTLGDVSGPPDTTPEVQDIFYALSCRDDLLTVATTIETVYAELPCSQYWLSDDVVRPYFGKPVWLHVSVGPQRELLIEASSPGPAQPHDGKGVGRSAIANALCA